MYRTRRLRGHMAGNSQRPAKLAKEPLDAVGILLDSRKQLRIRAFEVGMGNDSRPAMPRPDNVHHVQVALVDETVQMNIDEIQPNSRAPVPEQPRLDIFESQRLLQKRIVLEINLAYGEIVGSAPISVHLLQQFGAERGLRLVLNWSVIRQNRFIRHTAPRWSN